MKILKKIGLVIGNFCIIILIALSTMMCTSISWMFETWPYLNMQELMFQIQSPITGTNRDIINDYVFSCIPITVIVLIVLVGVMITLRKRKKLYIAVTSGMLLLSVSFGVGFFCSAWNRLDVHAYIENSNTYSNFIDTNYTDPSDTELTFPEQKEILSYFSGIHGNYIC